MLIDRDRYNSLQRALILGIMLSETLKDALKLQTLQCLKREGLAEREIERVREALMDLDASLDNMKGELKSILTAYKIGDILKKSVNGILEKI